MTAPVMLRGQKAMLCGACKAEICWEQFGGMLLYTEIDGHRVYKTRCACGTVYRNRDGGLSEVTP